MDKTEALRLLGGNEVSAAERIGVTRQAINKWPQQLPPRIADRVMAAIAREKGLHLAAESLAGQAST